jgi:hypothetical protein
VQILEIIKAVNKMLSDSVIENYAIGGAVGATFYLEPVATLDVDVFVTFKAEPGNSLVSPKPIFDYLKAQGSRMEGEYIIIGGWPVQFLPPTGPLVEEALREAAVFEVEGFPTRVFTAEHLAAIALQTGRAKDKARLLQFIESDALNVKQFQEIIATHCLNAAWKRFEQQFLGEGQ